MLIALLTLVAIVSIVLAMRPRERIVERQLVVSRCTYCSALTPIDVTICEACGARSK